MTLCRTYVFLVMLFTFNMAYGIDVRLTPGPSIGLLQVFRNDAWGVVCNGHFEREEAEVVCRQLGLNTTSNRYFTVRGTGPVLINDMTCIGNETELDDCNVGIVPCCCSNTYNIGLACFDAPQSLVWLKQESPTYKEGVWVQLNCYIGSTETWSRKWTYNGQEYASSSNSLSFYAKRIHHGNWTCLAIDNRGNVIGSDSTMVTVLYPPVALVQRIQYARIGDSVNLSFAESVPPPYSYKWRKAGLPSVATVTQVMPTLTNIQPEDAGEYVVELDYDSLYAGKLTKAQGTELMTIVVSYPPVIKCEGKVSVNINDAVTLECDVDSWPTPKLITWSFFKTSWKTIQTGKNNVYQIDKAHTSDSGIYSCTAVNTMTDADANTKNGVGSCNMTLTVGITDCPVAQQSTTPNSALFAVTGVLIVVIIVFAVAATIVVIRMRKPKKETKTNRDQTDLSHVDGQRNEHTYLELNTHYETPRELPQP